MQQTTTPVRTGIGNRETAPQRIWMIAAAGVVVLALAALREGGWRLGLAPVIGAAAGMALYHASFGFASAWRQLLASGRGAGLRAQLLLLALVIGAAFPLMAWGEGIGLAVSGWVFPFGVAAAIGAYLFGVGMQLGGGCGSGTLYTAGGGSTRMMVTLAAFVAGSLLATWHWAAWQRLPALPPMSLLDSAGPVPALLVALTVLAAVWWASVVVERRRHGALEVRKPTVSLLAGPWSREAGAVALAGVCVATLIVLQRPWGITSAFALWGAKLAQAAGVEVSRWAFWEGNSALAAPLLADATTVMDLGLVLGAMVAAGLAGKFAPALSLTRRDVLTAIAGGLLMGYGARLSWGCNIGAYLGGLASGSLHGLGWMVLAMLGSVAGIAMRRRLNMD